MEDKKIWVFKSVSDEDRSYRSIGSYDDELMTRYVYDNFVANHKQVKKGDQAVIIDKEKILGFVRIEGIKNEPAKKKRGRCPHCGATNFEARKNKLPLYRCNKGHEFESIVEETVNATNFIANYGGSFIKPGKNTAISVLRPFYANRYNRNMSIQLLSPKFFDDHFSDIPQMLSSDNFKYILPTEAEENIKETELSDDYTPKTEDERNKLKKGEDKENLGII